MPYKNYKIVDQSMKKQFLTFLNIPILCKIEFWDSFTALIFFHWLHSLATRGKLVIFSAKKSVNQWPIHEKSVFEEEKNYMVQLYSSSLSFWYIYCYALKSFLYAFPEYGFSVHPVLHSFFTTYFTVVFDLVDLENGKCSKWVPSLNGFKKWILKGISV